ncbi:hypothetical protein ACFL3Q_04460 [Planctomycetota bacterium]
MVASFTANMARHILSTEKSPVRFEAFCCDLFSEIDSCQYVSTSWNYDQGRDGRTADLDSSRYLPVLSVSLRKDPKNKAEEDAKKIAGKPFPPKIVRFCVLQEDGKDVTEATLDKVKTIFYDSVDSIETVLADGILQISELAVQHPGCFEKYYLSELRNLKRALALDSANSGKIEITGMRIALTTQFSDDANELRRDLLVNLVLSVLSSANQGIDGICKNVSDSLKLPRVVSPAYLLPILDELLQLNLIIEDTTVYGLTEQGKQEIERRTDEGAGNLINGQQLIRNTIHELTGDDPEPDSFSRVWRIVQDEIANMFLANGIYVIQSIESIMTNESKITDQSDLYEAIKSLAQKIADLGVWGNRADAVLQAIKDLFNENDSEAYKWLAQLGTIYISLCSLGLEPTAQRQIQEKLREIDLLLDTDVILSFLSRGESYHEAITHIVKTWQKISGNIWVTACVLEEAAYHAWIANNEYEEIWRDLKKYDNKASLRLINNAFVRGFRAESRKYTRKHWTWYISTYRGKSSYDYSKIESLLKDSYIFKTDVRDINKDLAQDVTERLVQMRGIKRTEIDDEELDKYRRDGLLVSTLQKCRERREALIVSSSTRLCEACKNKKEELGSIEPVASISAIAYLLTLIPGVNMNMGTLKGLLFNPTYARKIRGIDRTALRMIQASEEYMMPFSRRLTLHRQLTEKIQEVATQLGKPPTEVTKQFECGTLDMDSTAHIVARAIDDIVQSKSEKTIHRLEQEIKRLKSRK